MGSRAVRVLAIAAGIVVASYVSTAASGAPDDPPGNNGTVKIDGVPFDDHPGNEPHVGCTFQVDFHGFDEGDLDATVTFESHPPTGPVQVLLTDTVFIGEDDNAGGGSEAGLDASETYTLSFTGIESHPNQGFHVKLTVEADGSQGADVKHKVFWVSECPPAPTTTTTSSTTSTSTTSTSTTSTTSTSTTSTTSPSTTSTTGTTSSTTSTTQVLGTTATTSGTTSTTVGGTTSTTGATTSTTAPAVGGVSVTQTTQGPTTTGAQVAGVQVERAPTRPTSLARTGLPLLALTLAGVGLVLAGQAARQRARR